MPPAWLTKKGQEQLLQDVAKVWGRVMDVPVFASSERHLYETAGLTAVPPYMHNNAHLCRIALEQWFGNILSDEEPLKKKYLSMLNNAALLTGVGKLVVSAAKYRQMIVE
jgi:hypothetical protein